MTTPCPCGSSNNYDTCCEPLITENALADTPEQLMRSRYTAYTQANIPYLKSTLTKKSQSDFDAKSTKEWAEGVEWKGLKVISTTQGGRNDKKGVVEFVAKYAHKNETVEHHEVARFERNEAGHWKFDDGDAHTHKEGESHHHGHDVAPIKTVVREGPKIGRNDPCPCGSGKKYKVCCSK